MLQPLLQFWYGNLWVVDKKWLIHVNVINNHSQLVKSKVFTEVLVQEVVDLCKNDRQLLTIGQIKVVTKVVFEKTLIWVFVNWNDYLGLTLTYLIRITINIFHNNSKVWTHISLLHYPLMNIYNYRMVKNTLDLVVRALTKLNSHHELGQISSMEPFFTHLNNLRDFYS